MAKSVPRQSTRERVLRALAKKRGGLHRYTRTRWVVGGIATLAIALLPLCGVLRFDLWRGRHMVLGELVGPVEAAKAFAFPFLGINLLILVATRFVGRYLCGFACPYGSMARLAEWVRSGAREGGQRSRRGLLLLAICALLCAVALSFWVDLRVFAEGSANARAIAGGVLIALTLALFCGVRWLGLRFCRDWCPSGVYFALLGPESSTAVAFAHPESCTDCRACEKVCPMELAPREIVSGEPRRSRGFYPDALPSLALCIRCGDCVAVCEELWHDPSRPTALEMGWLARRSAGAERSAEHVPDSRARADEEGARA